MRTAIHWLATDHALRPKARWFKFKFCILDLALYFGIVIGALVYNPAIGNGNYDTRLVILVLVACLVAHVVARLVRNATAPK